MPHPSTGAAFTFQIPLFQLTTKFVILSEQNESKDPDIADITSTVGTFQLQTSAIDALAST
jgi:hypothetical protein